LIREVVGGKIEGKRPRGRTRVKMLDGLIRDEHYSVIKRRALDKDRRKSGTIGIQGPASGHGLKAEHLFMR